MSMHMKRRVFPLLIVTLMLISTIAYANDIQPYADKVFDSASITLYSDKTASFYAITAETKKSISVTSCFLQRKNDGKWEYAKSLPAPSDTTTNMVLYGSDADYSKYIPDGGTYRIGAVFNADGYEVTRYSSGKAF